jgi:drug/metabolite transporter (DMT)-like permease
MGIADGIALYAVQSDASMPNAKYAAVTSSMFGLPTIDLAWMFLKERMSLAQWAGYVVAFAGVEILAV